jgi:hypothetical protein
MTAASLVSYVAASLFKTGTNGPSGSELPG